MTPTAVMGHGGRSSAVLAALVIILSLLVPGVPAQQLTASFDISGSHAARRFHEFIADTRAKLRVSGQPYVTAESGRLPPQEDVPSRFMDHELRTARHAVTLRIRVDNLYAIGFRNGVGEGDWFELQHDNNMRDTTLIQGSTGLSFGGSYGDGSNLGRVTPELVIGRLVVEDAIDSLGSYDGTTNVNQYILTNSFRTLVVNFVEALRFTAVADCVATYMAADDDDDDGEPSGSSRPNFGTLGSLERLIRNWGYLSSALYGAVTGVVQDAQVTADRLLRFNNLDGVPPIHDAATLAQALGMVLPAKQKTKQPWGRSVGDGDVAAGIKLVEVMGVTVTRIDDEDPGDLYGDISIDDSIGAQQLFYRDRSDPQSVRPGEPALLAGPVRAVSASDGFAIYVNLMDKDTDPSPDDEVSSGVVVWNSLEATGDEYDVPSRRIIDGAYGSVELNFAVMSNAAVATVEVVMLDSSEGAPDVYGFVSANTSLGDSTSQPMMAISTQLLARSSDEAAGVEKGSAVPLHHKVVAVPLTSMLEITVNLLDRNVVLADEQIANGTVSFQPRLARGESAEVSGDYGRVAVRVDWTTWFE